MQKLWNILRIYACIICVCVCSILSRPNYWYRVYIICSAWLVLSRGLICSSRPTRLVVIVEFENLNILFSSFKCLPPLSPSKAPDQRPHQKHPSKRIFKNNNNINMPSLFNYCLLFILSILTVDKLCIILCEQLIRSYPLCLTVVYFVFLSSRM